VINAQALHELLKSAFPLPTLISHQLGGVSKFGL
jgi:hypothetical protein